MAEMTGFRGYLKNRLSGKKVLILGFGREGISSLKLIAGVPGIEVIGIADGKSVDKDKVKDALKEGGDLYKAKDIRTYEGDSYLESIKDFDILLKSPGIVFNEEQLELLSMPGDEEGIKAGKCELLSQMQLLYENKRDDIIGITGTKGKSTTTTLTHHILKENGFDALLGGNIGIPAFELVNDFDKLEKEGKKPVLVLEMSCHQLEYMNASPKRGILLNIYEEHLDHYGTFEKYEASKRNIYVNQIEGDILYVGKGFEPEDGSVKSEVKVISLEECKLDIPKDEIKLVGLHNYTDIAFVYSLAKDMGVEDDGFIKALKSYDPLPHRLQKLGEKDGIIWYDDSISTIDETTIQALNTLKDTDTVIIGGMDRGISYVNLEDYLKKSYKANVILMDESGKRIADEMGFDVPDAEEDTDADKIKPIKAKSPSVYYVNYMKDAVALSKKITKPGKCVVLSPAAASYNRFKNFEDRGDQFKKMAGFNDIETVELTVNTDYKETTEFEKNEYIYSETLGVCKVSDIPKLSVNRRVTKSMDYYKLRPVSETGKRAYIPVKDHKMEMRKLISLEEAVNIKSNEEEYKALSELRKGEVDFVIERDKKEKERKLREKEYRAEKAKNKISEDNR